MDTRFGPRASWLDEDAMARYIAADMLEIDRGNLRATRAGRLLLDGMLADLLPDHPPAG
jgi:coproporphyrinogen III oxidase-like Fe-S oxidoreductase